MLKSLVNFSKSKNILVCETDGFMLRAAVYTRTGNELAILQTAESQQSEVADAVSEVIKSLKNDGWEGGDAVLLSSTVLSTLIELPVNPKKQRPLAQMTELIRWEAEPLLSQHMSQFAIGNLLVGRGYMTQEQADIVMDLQQGQPNNAAGLDLLDKYTSRRFGEIAQELGYIKRSQLNACLARQTWLKSDDDSIDFGWSAQAEVSDIPGTYLWQVSAVAQSLLKRWISVFKLSGVHLKAMYPLVGSSASVLGKYASPQVLVESHVGMSFTMRIDGNYIVEQRHYVNPSQDGLHCCLEGLHSLSLTDDDQVSLADWDKDNHSIHQDLASAINRDVALMRNNAINAKSSPGMMGVGLHVLKMGKNRLLNQVRLGGPLPSLIHRPSVRAGILLGSIFCLILLGEITLAARDVMASSKKAAADEKWALIDGAMKRINADIKLVEESKKALKNQLVDAKREQQWLTFFGEALPERASLVQIVLGILQQALSDHIVINSIDEFARPTTLLPNPLKSLKDPRIEVESFNIHAWALSETAAQQFIQNLKKSAEPWQLSVVDTNVIGQMGQLNLQGFKVSLRIVKLVDEASLSEEASL